MIKAKPLSNQDLHFLSVLWTHYPNAIATRQIAKIVGLSVNRTRQVLYRLRAQETIRLKVTYSNCTIHSWYLTPLGVSVAINSAQLIAKSNVLSSYFCEQRCK